MSPELLTQCRALLAAYAAASSASERLTLGVRLAHLTLVHGPVLAVLAPETYAAAIAITRAPAYPPEPQLALFPAVRPGGPDGP